jgi:hypothetical protein
MVMSLTRCGCARRSADADAVVVVVGVLNSNFLASFENLESILSIRFASRSLSDTGAWHLRH